MKQMRIKWPTPKERMDSAVDAWERGIPVDLSTCVDEMASEIIRLRQELKDLKKKYI